MKNIILVIITIFVASGCSSRKEAAKTEQKTPQQRERKERPSIDEIFKMDTSGDGKLSKEEVQGPLQRDFSKIDSNGDGFISRTELENAPKIERGQRPPKK